MKQTFGKRLKDVMEEKRITQKELCKLTGISTTTLSNAMNDISRSEYNKEQGVVMKCNNLIKICNVLNVSADYLLGLTNVQDIGNTEIKEVFNMNELRKDRIEAQLLKLNKTKGWLANQMNMSIQSLSRMLGGNNKPRIDNIIELSKILNVSIDYLLGVSNESSVDVSLKDMSKKTRLSEKTINILSSLDEDSILLIEDFIKMIKERSTVCNLN